MKGKILLLVTMLTLCCSICFAYPNEPNGFREMQWGDSIAKLFQVYDGHEITDKTNEEHHDDNVVVYRVVDKNTTVSGLPVREPFRFYFLDNKLVTVTFSFEVEQDLLSLADTKNELLKRMTYVYGEPTYTDAKVHENSTFVELYSWLNPLGKTLLNLYAISPIKENEKYRLFISMNDLKYVEKSMIMYEENQIKEAKQGW